jgi:cardiolipin synthase
MQAALASADSSPWLVITVALVGELLALVFVYRIIVRGGSPASTLLWIIVILATPWIGLLLYYLMPRRLEIRRLRKMRVRGARFREVRARRGLAGREAREDRSGLRALLGDGEAELVPGNRLRWLASGEEFTAAAAEAIEAARHHVHCLTYIFRPDAAGMRFLGVLERAARRGVQVRLLYDSFGSMSLKSSHLAPLHAAGGRAVAFMPLLWKRRPFTVNLRNHRKLLVVDGEVGYVGGRNVGDEYFTDRLGRSRRWLDAMLELKGPVVERMQDVFVEDWHTATDEVLQDLGDGPPPPVRGGTEVAVVCSGPDREQSDLWFTAIQAIGEARASIDMSSPYLVPPPTLLFVLQLAVARGVRVRIFTNGSAAESPILYHAQRSYYRQFLGSGIELYETAKEYNHAKVLVVDEKIIVVGSANMDLRSAHLNFEIAVAAIDAPEEAAAVLATIEQRRAQFRRVTEADLPTNPFWRAIDGFCGLLSPLL